MATINIRNIETEVAESIALAAAARGQTYAQFVTANFALFKEAHAAAKNCPPVAALLAKVGLEEVRL